MTGEFDEEILWALQRLNKILCKAFKLDEGDI